MAFLISLGLLLGTVGSIYLLDRFVLARIGPLR